MKVIPGLIVKSFRKKPYGHVAYSRKTKTGKIALVPQKGAKPLEQTTPAFSKNFERKWKDLIKNISTFKNKEYFKIKENGIEIQDDLFKDKKYFLSKDMAQKIFTLYSYAKSYVKDLKNGQLLKVNLPNMGKREGIIKRIDKAKENVLNIFIEDNSGFQYNIDPKYISLDENITVYDVVMSYKDIFKYTSNLTNYGFFAFNSINKILPLYDKIQTKKTLLNDNKLIKAVRKKPYGHTQYYRTDPRTGKMIYVPPKGTKPVEPTTSKEPEFLTQEAKKYESAEEFAKNMLFLGWIKSFGAYAHIQSLSELSENDLKIMKKEFEKELKKEGVEGIGRIVRNTSNFYKHNIPDILTKHSQLIDFYNKVKKEQKESESKPETGGPPSEMIETLNEVMQTLNKVHKDMDVWEDQIRQLLVGESYTVNDTLRQKFRGFYNDWLDLRDKYNVSRLFFEDWTPEEVANLIIKLENDPKVQAKYEEARSKPDVRESVYRIYKPPDKDYFYFIDGKVIRDKKTKQLMVRTKNGEVVPLDETWKKTHPRRVRISDIVNLSELLKKQQYSKRWEKYAPESWEINSVLRTAEKLEESGKYERVKVVRTHTEGGKEYGNIYVIEKTKSKIPDLNLEIGDKVEVYDANGKLQGIGRILEIQQDNSILIRNDLTNQTELFHSGYEFRKIESRAKTTEPNEKSLNPNIKPMGETFKEMATEQQNLAEKIEKLQPDELEGWRTKYKKVIIDGDLFYTGENLERPLTPMEVAQLLSEEQKAKLLIKE